jgi:hypothetical protein
MACTQLFLCSPSRTQKFSGLPPLVQLVHWPQSFLAGETFKWKARSQSLARRYSLSWSVSTLPPYAYRVGPSPPPPASSKAEKCCAQRTGHRLKEPKRKVETAHRKQNAWGVAMCPEPFTAQTLRTGRLIASIRDIKRCRSDFQTKLRTQYSVIKKKSGRIVCLFV